MKGDESSGTAPQNGFRRRDEQDGSVGSYVFSMLRGYLDNVSKQEGPEKRKLFLSILQQLVSEEFISNACSSLFDLDMDAFDSYKEFSGGDFALPTGYQAILDSILKDIPEDRLHLNQPVTKIAWMNNSDGEEGEIRRSQVSSLVQKAGRHQMCSLFSRRQLFSNLCPSLPLNKTRFKGFASKAT
ncbi:putative spermine oxidase-like [Apostichopus japonicus]|uniref:Putative spermine oxidase-like n=1 Tax=Stichopus japonicus TaxID=307972 RepID=A0A2G8JB46_STIJA|nr:putative spermine oxidase-like [Apostichopus japonicus]